MSESEAMHVQPVTLEGRDVTLAPLTMEHSEGLWAVATPELFVYMFNRPIPWDFDGFQRYMEKLLEPTNWLAFVILSKATGAPIGTTSFMDIRAKDRGLEIGSTWVAQPYQGTRVNPECKYLLLTHAFETLGAIRVQLKTDRRNLHSQRAIQKLGAVHEGVLRSHYIMPDGYFRDTMMYSIIAPEWPEIKARLEARLATFP